MHRFLFLLFPILFFLSCTPHREETIKIESFQQLNEIPSASGVEFIDQNIWMVGDDSPYLFQFDLNLNLIQKFKISSLDSMINNRVLKTEKADFESLASDGENLFILSSGSFINRRDTLFIFSLEDFKLQSIINMRPVFDSFRLKGSFKNSEQINIEGLAAIKSGIFILNRGNIINQNNIYYLSYNEIDQFYEKGTVENISFKKYQLPEINGFLSGFSGACINDDETYLYFTSSVEATNDVYQDGEVLGSFIGRIHLESNKLEYWPLTRNNEFIKTKLESISIIEHQTEFIRFVCTSDNDDGSSGVYHLKLNLKN